jgi:hypothetical protein
VGSAAKGYAGSLGFQQVVKVACAAFNDPSFGVMPALAMVFKNFWFCGGSYFSIGSGLLPFSITPTDGIFQQARAMLSVDQVRADAFDLGADPEIGDTAPGYVARLHHLIKYVAQSWMEARSQLHSK